MYTVIAYKILFKILISLYNKYITINFTAQNDTPLPLQYFQGIAISTL